jgi:hypothetical protein
MSERNCGKNGPGASPIVVLEYVLVKVVLMSAQIMVFISDDVERMCDLFEINPRSFMVDALQEHIHAKAIVRACTRFNTSKDTRMY